MPGRDKTIGKFLQQFLYRNLCISALPLAFIVPDLTALARPFFISNRERFSAQNEEMTTLRFSFFFVRIV